MKNLKSLFLAELADIYDAEKGRVKSLPKMAKAATCNHLKAAILAHLEETKGHVSKLEEVFACFGIFSAPLARHHSACPYRHKTTAFNRFTGFDRHIDNASAVAVKQPSESLAGFGLNTGSERNACQPICSTAFKFNEI